MKIPLFERYSAEQLYNIYTTDASVEWEDPWRRENYHLEKELKKGFLPTWNVGSLRVRKKNWRKTFHFVTKSMYISRAEVGIFSWKSKIFVS